MFRDRADAGCQLALRLSALALTDPVVLGLPRGGVTVAAEVAAHLGARLDVVVVRKLGVPGSAEVAMGALGEGDVLVVNDRVVARAAVSEASFAAVLAGERRELERRVQRFRGGRSGVGLAGRAVVIVDDGVATGATARAACEVVRAAGATRIVLAVPVVAPDVLPSLEAVADEVVYVMAPQELHAVGQWYDDFRQVGDEEVVALLAAGATSPGSPRPSYVRPTS